MLSFLKNLHLGSLNPLTGNDGYVALDIGSSSIKMVEAAVDKSGYRVLNLGILPLPENVIQNNMVVDSTTSGRRYSSIDSGKRRQVESK